MPGKTMMRCLAFLTLLVLAACAGKETSPSGISYPPTDKVESLFRLAQVPEQCRVFAQLFVTLPAQHTGQQFVEAISTEAQARGADMMLIGQSRQSNTVSELAFTYYGPDREYRINDWPGWNFGFEEWRKQGAWANIGYEEWGNGQVRFDYPVVLQVALLRCRS
ncbi:MAG TPA: hypothetical protein DDY20_09510 [Desulfobulbaceae bacterium]|nr:hypothetical protein [Desulfobulbaceae bacterium]